LSLVHYVPLPEPGPPRTKTTCGFSWWWWAS